MLKIRDLLKEEKLKKFTISKRGEFPSFSWDLVIDSICDELGIDRKKMKSQFETDLKRDGFNARMYYSGGYMQDPNYKSYYELTFDLNRFKYKDVLAAVRRVKQELL